MAKRDGNWILTLMLVALIVAAAAFLVTSSYELTKSRIAANQRARLIASLNSVLDPALREHDLATVQLSVLDPELLGSREPVDVFVAIEAGQPVAAVFASVAPDGYNAAIRLLIGVTPAATLTGVRAVAHRETPGLGDAIDAAKSDWIEQFAGASLAMPPAVSWAVDKDDGAFDSITGATVTSRAVVGAVKSTLLYFEQHRVQLFQDAVNLSLANDADPE